MKNVIRFTSAVTVFAAVLALAAPLAAQTREGLMGDLIKDITDLKKKVMGLANAMPDSAYAWKPADGVRTTGEVLAHVAADNYFLPALLDKAAPKETGITKDYKTTVAFEKRKMDKAATIAELQKSFAFLRTSMTSTTDAELTTTIDMFGQKSTVRGVWLTTATHLHEHLGQLIAYARANKVTPPWSK
jgi:uncharacterized damage-inducible protein DinB